MFAELKELIESKKFSDYKERLEQAGYNFVTADNNWDAEGSRYLGYMEGYNSALDVVLEIINISEPLTEEQMKKAMDYLEKNNGADKF